MINVCFLVYYLHTAKHIFYTKKDLKKTVYGNIILYSEYNFFKLVIKRKNYKNIVLKKGEIEK